MVYGLEALVLEENELQQLESYHRQNLRYIQHLPKSTAIPALHLLLGVPPVEALIDLQVLSLLRNIIAIDTPSPPSVFMKQLLERQLALKDLTSSSWAAHAKLLLIKYGLPPVQNLLENPPAKPTWKSMIREAVHKKWTEALQMEAAEKSSMSLINIEACSTRVMHPVWLNITCPLAVKKATVKAMLLTQRYRLTTCHTSGSRMRKDCPLCDEEPEDMAHFLLYCKALRKTRLPYLCRILETCRQHGISVDPALIVRVILDSNYLMPPHAHHEELCRNFIYKLHHRRSVLMGGVSAYKL